MELAHQCNVMQEKIKQWKGTIRPAKKMQQKLKEDDRDPGSIREAFAIVDCQELMWELRDVMTRAVAGSKLDTSEVKLVTSAVLTRLLYHSWQRPSAVKNATMSEFLAARQVTDDETGKSCWVMTVARHKTAREGPAHIMMTTGLPVSTQSMSDPTAENLFVGTGGTPITQSNKNIQWLGERYGVDTPCCTDLRQTGGTERCDEPTRRLISHQMSHSDSVHYKHYEKLGGLKKAAKAFSVRQRLAYGSDSEDGHPLRSGSAKQMPKEKKPQDSQPQRSGSVKQARKGIFSGIHAPRTRRLLHLIHKLWQILTTPIATYYALLT